MGIWKNKDGYYAKCDTCGHTCPIDSEPEDRTPQEFNDDMREDLHTAHWVINYSLDDGTMKDECPVCATKRHGVYFKDIEDYSEWPFYSFTGEYIRLWCEDAKFPVTSRQIQACEGYRTMKPNVYYFVREGKDGYYLKRDLRKSPRPEVQNANRGTVQSHA